MATAGTAAPRSARAEDAGAVQGWGISDREFGLLRDLLHRTAGIRLAPSKKALVCGRLARRLRERNLPGYLEYYRLITSGEAQEEMQIALDLLTTNETFFFRERRHFDFLREQAGTLCRPGQPFRVWSAACSSGEEVYSIAMTLAEALGDRPWEVLGSDISTRVLEKARAGHYSFGRTQDLPRRYLNAYCLKGIGSQEGTFLIGQRLRSKADFRRINLSEPLPPIGQFDVVFLRNVLIYFSAETKRQAVARVFEKLKPGGYLFVSHSETLNDVAAGVESCGPSIYRKPSG
jgi:chemotaxis protein methyltransferase CheR